MREPPLRELPLREFQRDPGCPAPEELTAHAHGEGSASARAALARHLLACAACRGAHDGDQRLLLELRALGASRSLPPPPHAPIEPSVERAAVRRWPAYLPPVAAALLVGLALLLPREPASGSGTAAEPALNTPSLALVARDEGVGRQRLAPLLGAQAADGHWEAEDGPLGTDDTSATGVVLLALLHESARRPHDDLLELAVRSGSRWLASRLGGADASLQGLAPGSRAVLLAALARSLTATGDRTLLPPSEALLHDLTTRLAQGGVEPSALPWVAYALEAAETAELPGARAARRDLGDLGTRAALALRSGPPPSVETAGSGAVVDCTPLRSAIEVLRDEPPVRTLALGPACRPPAPPRDR